MSEFSKVKLEDINFISGVLLNISNSIRTNDSSNYSSVKSLSKQIKEVLRNEKLKHLCYNFEIIFRDIYLLADPECQNIILETKSLLLKYITLLTIFYEKIEGNAYIYPQENIEFKKIIESNNILSNKINFNLLAIQVRLKKNSLYL